MCLTTKRQEFINQYFRCGFNATEAARRSGYKHPNKMGPRLTKEPEVAAEIKRRMDELSLTADQVVARLSEHATADISDYLTDYGAIDWDAVNNKGYLVKKATVYKGKSASIELHDSQSALTWLGKYHKLFTDRIIQEHKGKVELEHKLDLSNLTDEQLNHLAAIVESVP